MKNKQQNKPLNRSNHRFRIFILPIIVIAILTAIDQLSKFVITGTFALYESKAVIKDVFSITYIQNRGIAWGMLQGKRIIFLILTAVVLILCFYVYANIYGQKKYFPLQIGIIVLIAGALGNMIDRIKQGYVVDFFSFDFIDFPVFNVADIYVVVSMIYIFLLVLLKYNNEEFDEIIGFGRTEGMHLPAEADEEIDAAEHGSAEKHDTE